MRTVAALYVEPAGPYADFDGVEVWDEVRDARTYAGPHPVVAHPPCLRWAIMSNCRQKRDGQDDGCFAAALASVRNYGGVLEHPAHSLAWRWFGLMLPPIGGGWVYADWVGGWTCYVDQGYYGHASRKPTWLYALGCDLPSLTWGDSAAPRNIARIGHGSQMRSCTPAPFRDLLLSMARSADGRPNRS